MVKPSVLFAMGWLWAFRAAAAAAAAAACVQGFLNLITRRHEFCLIELDGVVLETDLLAFEGLVRH